jgi:Cu-processing system permease protein
MNLRKIWLVAWSVLIEAVRRRALYVVVLGATLLIGAVMTIDFFELEGLTKFYREVALKVMGVAAALTVVFLAGRQLPREFEQRTIYPILARPLGRPTFLAGKLLGVMLAGAFCFALFMLVYLAGALYLGGSIPWTLFIQHVYLQLLMLLILATLTFWLSMLMNFDAAIAVGILFYALASTFMTVSSTLYEYTGAVGKGLIVACTWLIPQLPLFDLSQKAVHADIWPPLGAGTMITLTVYGLIFAGAYFALTLLWFRRRPL